MDVNTVRGLLTLAFLIAFVAIVFYAWSGRNRQRFDEAARLPLDENGN
jgi:cytochrome c oxidase cbb3-type subunit 4